MKIFEAIAHGLQEEGVDTMFGLMGDGNLRLLTYWGADLGQAFFSARHESAAVAMADGYARASGKVGVCTVTQGPGVTNTITALVTARKASSPLLLMVGDVASFQTGWPQDIDHHAVFAAAGVPLLNISGPDTAYSDLVRALRMAEELRTPVGLNLPTDQQELEWKAFEDETDIPRLDAESPEVDRSVIASMVDHLLAAKRPTIIAGRGAIEADCGPDLMNIGDRVGAILGTTLHGKGIFGSHEFCVGVVGGLGSNVASTLLGQADVVLAVGASLNDFTMMNGTLLSQKCLILRCDVKPEPTGNLVQEQLLAIGDAGVTVKELLRELESRGKTSVGYRPRAAETLSSYRPEDEFFEVTDEPGAVDPRSLTLALDRALPASRTVVTDAGHFFGFPVAYMNAEDGRAFLCSIDFGSIGLGIGMAFGASQARPENTTVLFIGDGGLLMSLGDLETLARYDVPMLVVVFNDAAYGSELQIIRMWGLKEDFSVFPRTDFAAVAESLGVRAIRVSSKEDVEALASQLSNGEISGLTLVDCSISRDVRAAWLEEAFRH